MTDLERLLRRLALNDEESVGMVLTSGSSDTVAGTLRPKVSMLVRLAALLSLGAATSSLRTTVEQAVQAGASEDELVAVLVVAAPAMGLARVVSSAPRLAMAIGYDVDEDD